MGVHISFVRSCDLDEWTQEQLDIMKISGNGNAKNFFKKHGVTETQMQSEKKYKTKAAQEYKRHLTKSLQEGLVGLSSPSMDKDDLRASKDNWDASTGIDRLMQSLSGTNLANMDDKVQSAPTSVFKVSQPPPQLEIPPPQQEPVNTSTKTVIKPSSPVANGVLSVSAVVEGEIKPTSELPKTTTTFSTGKKPIVKKSLGARKLSGSNADVKIESFESVEKRATKVYHKYHFQHYYYFHYYYYYYYYKAAQEEEDKKLAISLQKAENNSSSEGGSSRIASIYQETQTQSIYRAPPSTQQTSTSVYSNRPISNSNTVVSKVGESYQARERYSSAKGISSDQFFGREEEDTLSAREKLSKFSSATAIGSDMLYNDGQEEDYGMDSYTNNSRYSSNSQSSGISLLLFKL